MARVSDLVSSLSLPEAIVSTSPPKDISPFPAEFLRDTHSNSTLRVAGVFPLGIRDMKRKRESVEVETTARTKLSKHSENEAEDTTTKTRETDSNINTAIGKMDNRLLADYVAQRTKGYGEDLSLVELEDMHVPGKTERECLLAINDPPQLHANLHQRAPSSTPANGTRTEWPRIYRTS